MSRFLEIGASRVCIMVVLSIQIVLTNQIDPYSRNVEKDMILSHNLSTSTRINNAANTVNNEVAFNDDKNTDEIFIEETAITEEKSPYACTTGGTSIVPTTSDEVATFPEETTPPTEPPTEPSTELPTEETTPPTEPPTEPSTELPTEETTPPTELPTEETTPPTEPPTEPSTELPTEETTPPTELPTEETTPPTEPPTEPSTELPTKETTIDATPTTTEPTTTESTNFSTEQASSPTISGRLSNDAKTLKEQATTSSEGMSTTITDTKIQRNAFPNQETTPNICPTDPTTPNSNTTTEQSETTEAWSTTNLAETTTQATTTENITTEVPTSTNTTTPTMTTESPSTTTEIPSTTTTLPPFTKNTPPPGGCSPECEKIDSIGHHWKSCPGSLEFRECKEVNANSSGQIIWYCSTSGEFVGDQPDYSQCKTNWLEEYKSESEKVNKTTAVEYLDRLRDRVSPEQSNSSYFGHEIDTLNTILGTVVQTVGNSVENSSDFVKVASMSVGIVERLVATPEPWLHLNLLNRSNLSTKLLQTIEETSFLLTSKVNIVQPLQSAYASDGVSAYVESLIAADKFTVTSLAYTPTFDGLDKLTYPIRPENQDSVIRMPPGWVELVAGNKIECIGMFMDQKYASLIMPGQFKLGLDSDEHSKKVLNGQVMSFTVASNSNDSSIMSGRRTNFTFPGRGVQISFKHEFEAWGEERFDIRKNLRSGDQPKVAKGSAQCIFWDESNLRWSGSGCHIVYSTSLETVCECNHLTSFAILMDVHNYVGRNRGLEILTLILCPISILCLIATIAILSLIRMARSQRTTITLHLAICLAIGNFLILLVLDRDYLNLGQGMCVASGIVTHYTFLTAFGWMAFQGIHLYHMVVNIFSFARSPFFIYKLISYGAPFLIICITAMSGYLSGDEPYGGELVCWLNGPYIWGFIGPVLIIVLMNTAILSVSLWKSFRIRNRPMASATHKRRVSSIRTWIQGSLALTILLGITWLVGYIMLAPSISGLIASYFFTILNASQGIFIFIFDCVFNDKVRLGVHRQYGQYLPTTVSTWLKTSASPSSVVTTSTGVDPSSARKRKDSFTDSNTNSNNSSVRPVPELAPVPRVPRTVVTPIPLTKPEPQGAFIDEPVKSKIPSTWDEPVLRTSPEGIQPLDDTYAIVIRSSAIGDAAFSSC